MTGRLISPIKGGAALLVWSAIGAVPAAAAGAPTFSKEVAPILYKSCANCHRPGEIAPMSLLSMNKPDHGPNRFAKRSWVAKCHPGMPANREGLS